MELCALTFLGWDNLLVVVLAASLPALYFFAIRRWLKSADAPPAKKPEKHSP